MHLIGLIIYFKQLKLFLLVHLILLAIIFNKCIKLLKKKLFECLNYIIIKIYYFILEVIKSRNNIVEDANKFMKIKYLKEKVKFIICSIIF